MGCKKWEIRNKNLSCSHPISHFPDGILVQKIELGPEKWEMGTKSEFSSLKVRPLASPFLPSFLSRVPFIVAFAFDRRRRKLHVLPTERRGGGRPKMKRSSDSQHKS